jgi:branched-chain amino acid transport system substrate-binding protein
VREWTRTARTGFLPVAGLVFAVLIATTALVATPVVAASAASAASNALGAPDPASGPAVTVGMIIDGHAGATDGGAGIEQGARMAVRYQNEFGNGLDGHKIDLRFCANDETAAGGLLCATDMVQHHVVAVIEPSSGQGQSEVPTLESAGIPYITMTGGSAAELTTTGAFALQGGVPAILGAVALQAKERGYSKVSVIVENTPTTVLGAQVVGGIVFKAAGVDFEILKADPNARNVEPQLREAIAGGASAVGVGGNVTLCTAFLKAYTAVHAHLPKYVISTCLGPSIVDSPSLDSMLKGSMLAGADTATRHDDALYAAIVHEYAPSVNANPNISSQDFAGLLPVLSLAAIMKGAPASQPVTPAGILARTETAKDVVLPLFGGATFTCDGTAMPILKSVCSSTSAIGVLGRGYRVNHVKSYDASALY